MKIRDDISWIPKGANRATKALISWVKEPNNRDQVLKRLAVAASVPVGSAMLISHNPPLFIASIIVICVVVCARFGHDPVPEMTIHEHEYALPYEVEGEPMTAKEVLKKFLEKYPEEDMEGLAKKLSKASENGEFSSEILEGQLRLWGLPVPSLSTPSPTEVEPLPSPGEEAGQDHDAPSRAGDPGDPGGGDGHSPLDSLDPVGSGHGTRLEGHREASQDGMDPIRLGGESGES